MISPDDISRTRYLRYLDLGGESPRAMPPARPPSRTPANPALGELYRSAAFAVHVPLQTEGVTHVISPATSGGQPAGRMDGANGKGRAVTDPMREFDPFPAPGEDDGMLAGDVAATDRRIANLAFFCATPHSLPVARVAAATRRPGPPLSRGPIAAPYLTGYRVCRRGALRQSPRRTPHRDSPPLSPPAGLAPRLRYSCWRQRGRVSVSQRHQ